MKFTHRAGITIVLLGIFSGSHLFSQSNDSTGTKNMNSPYTLIRSIENIGSELLSLFGSDDNNETNTTAKAPKRRSVKVMIVFTSGKPVITQDAKNCESGNGICTFKIYPANQAPAEGTKLPATAVFLRRQRKLIVEFDQPADASLQGESGKVILSVRRRPNDPSDDDATLVLKNKRLIIKNGDYEVSENRLQFILE